MSLDASEVRGVSAGLTWQYYKAADVANYVVTRTGRPPEPYLWTVSGWLRNADAYKLAQRPLRFVAPHKHGAWYWPVASLTRADGNRFYAELGPLIDRDTLRL